jgi:hypothetical protein
MRFSRASFSHRSEAQHIEAYAAPLRQLRPYWTACLSILRGMLLQFPMMIHLRLVIGKPDMTKEWFRSMLKGRLARRSEGKAVDVEILTRPGHLFSP